MNESCSKPCSPGVPPSFGPFAEVSNSREVTRAYLKPCRSLAARSRRRDAACRRRRRGLRQGLSAGDAQRLAVDEAGLLGGEEDEGGGEFRWLSGAPHRRGAAELGDRLAGHGGWDDRGPHRTRRHGVRPEPVGYDLLG